MACATGSAHSPTTDERLLDRLPPVGEFCCKDQFPPVIVHHSKPGGSTAGINLETQRVHQWCIHRTLEDHGEWVALEHGGFASLEQQARSARMDRVQRVFIRINDKDL
jgi:hypothetical protein